MSSSASGFRNKYFLFFPFVHNSNIFPCLGCRNDFLLLLINSRHNSRTIVLRALVSVSHLLVLQDLLAQSNNDNNVYNHISDNNNRTYSRIQTCAYLWRTEVSSAFKRRFTTKHPWYDNDHICQTQSTFKPQNHQISPTGRNSVGEWPEAEPIARTSNNNHEYQIW